MLPAVPGHLARVFQFLAHHRGSYLEFPCVLQDVVATSQPTRGGRGSARRAPELVSGRRDVPGVLQDMLGLSRSTSGPKEISRDR